MQVLIIKQTTQNNKTFSSIPNKEIRVTQNRNFQNLDEFNFGNPRKNVNFKGKQFPSGYYTDEEIKLAKKYLHVENFLEPLTDDIWSAYGVLDRILHNKEMNGDMATKVKSIIKLRLELKDEILTKEKNAYKVESDLVNEKLAQDKLHEKQAMLEKNIKLEKINKKKEQLGLESKKLDLEEENIKTEKELIKEQKLSDYTGTIKTEFINLAKLEKKEIDSGKIPSKRLFPNGIMLSGLDKNVSDEIIHWTVKKSGCKFKKIDFKTLNAEGVIKELSNITNESRQTNTRTIIHVENFEKFTEPSIQNEDIINKLKAFLSDCAEKYNCTVITNVKDSSKLASEITADQRFAININAND